MFIGDLLKSSPVAPCYTKVHIYQANKAVRYAAIISEQAKLTSATYVCILL